MSITPAETDPEGMPGEHIKLTALFNRFAFNPISRRESMRPGKPLLQRHGPKRTPKTLRFPFPVPGDP